MTTRDTLLEWAQWLASLPIDAPITPSELEYCKAAMRLFLNERGIVWDHAQAQQFWRDG